MRFRLRGKNFNCFKNNVENLHQKGKIINKLLLSAENKKTTNTNKIICETFQPGNINNIFSRRMEVLNSVFKSHIIELMSNGKNSFFLHNLGIEVTKVRLDNNYKNLNVYWIATNDEEEDLKVAEVLKNVTGEIQNELNTLGLVGKPPKIKFIKDIFEIEEEKVKEILDKLNLKGEMTSKNFDNIIEINEKNSLPQMRHDIFGLYHSEIMKRLNSRMKDFAKAETQNFTGFISSRHSSDKACIPFEKKNFSKYLHKHYSFLKKAKNLQKSKVFLEDFSEYKNNEVYLINLNDDVYD